MHACTYCALAHQLYAIALVRVQLGRLVQVLCVVTPGSDGGGGDGRVVGGSGGGGGGLVAAVAVSSVVVEEYPHPSSKYLVF